MTQIFMWILKILLNVNEITSLMKKTVKYLRIVVLLIDDLPVVTRSGCISKPLIQINPSWTYKGRCTVRLHVNYRYS